MLNSSRFVRVLFPLDRWDFRPRAFEVAGRFEDGVRFCLGFEFEGLWAAMLAQWGVVECE